MRHYALTAIALAALLLNACAEAADQNATPAQAAAVERTDQTALPEKYQGLDRKYISRAEIDELISLNAESAKANQAHLAEIETWWNQDASSRGPKPKFNHGFVSQDKKDRLKVLIGKFDIAETRKRYQSFDPWDISQAEIDELFTLLPQAEAGRVPGMWQPSVPEFPQSERFMDLMSKVQMAEIRLKYKTLDPEVLSEAEVKEAIALEQDQLKDMLAVQEELQVWVKQDPATRGPQPQLDPAKHMSQNYRRLRALHAKIRGVR